MGIWNAVVPNRIIVRQLVIWKQKKIDYIMLRSTIEKKLRGLRSAGEEEWWELGGVKDG